MTSFKIISYKRNIVKNWKTKNYFNLQVRVLMNESWFNIVSQKKTKIIWTKT